MLDARGARRGGGRSCKPAASSSTLELSTKRTQTKRTQTKRNATAWVGIRDQAALQMLPAGFDSSTTCNEARESAANGGKRGPNPRDVAQARGVRFFRSPRLARSTSGEVAALSKPRDGIETRARHHHLFVQPARTPRSHRGNAGSTPAQVAMTHPRRMDRGQRYERRLRRFESSRGSEMVRLHPPVRKRRACRFCAAVRYTAGPRAPGVRLSPLPP